MTFAALALIVLVGLLGTALSLQQWLPFPATVWQLGLGTAFGATSLGVVSATNATFAFLAQVGFVLVMFVAGTHVPVRSRVLASVTPVGIMRALAVGLLAVPMAYLIGRLTHTPLWLLYAVVMASSSAALALPTLGDLRTASPRTLSVLPQIAVADALGIVLLPLVIDPPRAAHAAWGACALLVAAVGLGATLWWIQASGTRRRVHDVSEDYGLAIEIRVVFLAICAMSALALAVQASVMLAGFHTGLAVSAVGESRRVAHQVFALTEGFFGPIFFVWLGASLNVREVFYSPASLVLGLCLGGWGGDSAPSAYSTRAALADGFDDQRTTGSAIGCGCAGHPTGSAALRGGTGVVAGRPDHCAGLGICCRWWAASHWYSQSSAGAIGGG